MSKSLKKSNLIKFSMLSLLIFIGFVSVIIAKLFPLLNTYNKPQASSRYVAPAPTAYTGNIPGFLNPNYTQLLPIIGCRVSNPQKVTLNGVSCAESKGNFELSTDGKYSLSSKLANQYVYFSASGNSTFIAQIVDMGKYADAGSAKITMRDVAFPKDGNNFIEIYPAGSQSNKISVFWTGNNSKIVDQSYPIWIKMNHKDGILSAAYSKDGQSWTEIFKTKKPNSNNPVPNNYYYILSSNSGANWQTYSNTFKNISLTQN